MSRLHAFGGAASRRSILKLIGGLSLYGVLPQASARSQGSAWKPDGPVTIIVAFPPGGTNDILARMVAPGLSERLGQPVVIENRAGAGGSIGATAAYTADPNGLTLFAGVPSPLTLFPHMTKVAYEPDKFIPLAELGSVPSALFARTDLPVDNLHDLVALSKKQKLSYASGGVGSAPHLLMVMFQREAGIDAEAVVHVPYTGMAPALQAIMGKQVDLMIVTIGGVPIDASKYKVLGVTSGKRLTAYPSLETFDEQGIPMVTENFFGLFAPPNTSEEVCSALSDSIIQVVSSPPMRSQMEGMGVNASTKSRVEFAASYLDDIKNWGVLIKDAGLAIQ